MNSLKFSWHIHNNKTYTGKITPFGNKVVFINDNEGLQPARSLAVINHSPDGFNWGYNGSGPAQLALAILLDYTDNKDFAIRHHQQFKADIIAHLNPYEGWALTDGQIDQWIEENVSNS